MLLDQLNFFFRMDERGVDYITNDGVYGGAIGLLGSNKPELSVTGEGLVFEDTDFLQLNPGILIKQTLFLVFYMKPSATPTSDDFGLM